MIVGFAVAASMHKFPLVTENYYDKELVFESQIQAEKNANALTDALKIANTDGKVLFTFPASQKNISGEILFYSPSDSKKDKVFPIQLDDQNAQNIDIQNLRKGLWRVKVGWKVEGKEFYKEEVLVL
jgi:hypothetical protein